MMEEVSLISSTFLAATVLPAAGMPVIVWLLFIKKSSLLIIILATAGNTFGAYFSQWAGLYFSTHPWMKYLGKGTKKFDQAQIFIHKYKRRSAFFSGIPVIGDRIPLALGIMQVPLNATLVPIFLGKILRYSIMIYLLSNGIQLFN